MPTYEYACSQCKHQFEVFQSITADPLENCPKCNGPVQRLIGAGNGLIFKGSGFYITDYKNTGNSRPSDSANGKTKGNGDKSATTSETAAGDDSE